MEIWESAGNWYYIAQFVCCGIIGTGLITAICDHKKGKRR